MSTHEKLDAATLIRMADTTAQDRRAAVTATPSQPTTSSGALTAISTPSSPAVRLLSVVEDFSNSRLRARQEALLRRHALEHEADLRLKALRIEVARLEAKLDVHFNEQQAVLNANVLSSLGELLRTLESVRRSIEMALIRDRFSVLQDFADLHSQGLLSNEELHDRVERVAASFKAHDERMSAETQRCIEDAARLLRSPRGQTAHR